MNEIGKDLWRSSTSTPCSKQGQLQQLAQDCVQVGFEYLQGWSNLLQCVITLTVKKFFLIFKWNFLYFILCPLPLVFHWAPHRRVCLHLLYFPHQEFVQMGKIPLSLFFPPQVEQPQLSQLRNKQVPLN